MLMYLCSHLNLVFFHFVFVLWSVAWCKHIWWGRWGVLSWIMFLSFSFLPTRCMNLFHYRVYRVWYIVWCFASFETAAIEYAYGSPLLSSGGVPLHDLILDMFINSNWSCLVYMSQTSMICWKFLCESCEKLVSRVDSSFLLCPLATFAFSLWWCDIATMCYTVHTCTWCNIQDVLCFHRYGTEWVQCTLVVWPAPSVMCEMMSTSLCLSSYLRALALFLYFCSALNCAIQSAYSCTCAWVAIWMLLTLCTFFPCVFK